MSSQGMTSQNWFGCRFSRSPYSKVLALLYLTLALVVVGALALRAVTQQSFYSAVWETIAGAVRVQCLSLAALHSHAA
jgi:hypothetical protein